MTDDEVQALIKALPYLTALGEDIFSVVRDALVKKAGTKSWAALILQCQANIKATS